MTLRTLLSTAALALGACFGAIATLATPAGAQGFPTKPIRLVVTFPAAGAPDILARLFADKA